MNNKLFSVVLLAVLLCIITINTGFSNQIIDLKFEQEKNGFKFYLVDENNDLKYGNYFFGRKIYNFIFSDNTKEPYTDKLSSTYIIDLANIYWKYKSLKTFGIMMGIFGGVSLTLGLPCFIPGLIVIIMNKKYTLDLTDVAFIALGCPLIGFGILFSAIFAILISLCVYYYKKYNNTKKNIVEILNKIILSENENKMIIGCSIKI